MAGGASRVLLNCIDQGLCDRESITRVGANERPAELGHTCTEKLNNWKMWDANIWSLQCYSTICHAVLQAHTSTHIGDIAVRAGG